MTDQFPEVSKKELC